MLNLRKRSVHSSRAPQGYGPGRGGLFPASVRRGAVAGKSGWPPSRVGKGRRDWWRGSSGRSKQFAPAVPHWLLPERSSPGGNVARSQDVSRVPDDRRFFKGHFAFLGRSPAPRGRTRRRRTHSQIIFTRSSRINTCSDKSFARTGPGRRTRADHVGRIVTTVIDTFRGRSGRPHGCHGRTGLQKR